MQWSLAKQGDLLKLEGYTVHFFPCDTGLSTLSKMRLIAKIHSSSLLKGEIKGIAFLKLYTCNFI